MCWCNPHRTLDQALAHPNRPRLSRPLLLSHDHGLADRRRRDR